MVVPSRPRLILCHGFARVTSTETFLSIRRARGASTRGEMFSGTILFCRVRLRRASVRRFSRFSCAKKDMIREESLNRDQTSHGFKKIWRDLRRPSSRLLYGRLRLANALLRASRGSIERPRVKSWTLRCILFILYICCVVGWLAGESLLSAPRIRPLIASEGRPGGRRIDPQETSTVVGRPHLAVAGSLCMNMH